MAGCDTTVQMKDFMKKVVGDFADRSLLQDTGGESRVSAVSCNRQVKVAFNFSSVKADVIDGMNVGAVDAGTFVHKGLDQSRTALLDPAKSAT